MDKITEKFLQLLKEESKNRTLEQVFNQQEFFQLKKSIVRKVNEILNKEKIDRWGIRNAVKKFFEKASIDLETENIEKLIFLLITDAINERLPSPSPLAFEYKGNLIPKRHAIITDFELFPHLKDKVNQLNPEKKHLLVFSIFEDGKIISDGVSYYLSVIDYLIFLLLDKALYEEVIDLNKILIEEAGQITVNKKDIDFLIESIFSALFQYYTGEKEKLKTSILDKEYSKYTVKVKKLLSNTLSDKKEEKYLLDLAIEDERLSEDKKIYIQDKDIQENVFKEAKQRDTSEIDKIDAVIWLIGLNNIDLDKFFKYFDINNFMEFLKVVEKDIETGKEVYLKNLENFIEEILNNPEIYKKIKRKEEFKKFISEKFILLEPSILFLEESYEEFLEKENKKDKNTEIKRLFSKYKTGEIDKNELLNWLTLYENKEEINKNLLEFIKNG